MCNIYSKEGQFNFEQNLFENFTKYSNEHNIVYRTHTDLGCGLGYFTELMNSRGITSRGIDLSETMIEMAKSKFSNNYYVGDICNVKLPNPVDLITCNHNTINHLNTLDKWKEFMLNAYYNLSQEGYLLFDFNTIDYIETVSHFSYSQLNPNLDIIKIVIPNNNYQLQFRYIFYSKQKNEYYTKNIESILITCFKTTDIFKLITECGFNIHTTWDNQFNECQIDTKTIRFYILANKR